MITLHSARDTADISSVEAWEIFVQTWISSTKRLGYSWSPGTAATVRIQAQVKDGNMQFAIENVDIANERSFSLLSLCILLTSTDADCCLLNNTWFMSLSRLCLTRKNIVSVPCITCISCMDVYCCSNKPSLYNCRDVWKRRFTHRLSTSNSVAITSSTGALLLGSSFRPTATPLHQSYLHCD